MSVQEEIQERREMRRARRERLLAGLRSDRLNAVAWALVLFWGAVTLFLDVNNVTIGTWWDGGAFFAIGAGAVLLAVGLYQVNAGGRQRGVTFKVVVGTILLVAGIGQPLEFDGRYIGSTALLIIAAVVLFRAFRR
jgi:hypothetical protein